MRLLALLFLVVALSSCYAPPPARFQTRCGMRFLGTYPEGGPLFGWNREALQYAEDRTLQVFTAEVRDPHFTWTEICMALGGIQLFVHPDDSFAKDTYNQYLNPPPTSQMTPEQLDYQVAGISDCNAGYMVLADLGMVYKSAFSHEAAHFVQRCNAPAPKDRGVDEDHSNWRRDGIYDATEKVQGYR